MEKEDEQRIVQQYLEEHQDIYHPIKADIDIETNIDIESHSIPQHQIATHDVATIPCDVKSKNKNNRKITRYRHNVTQDSFKNESGFSPALQAVAIVGEAASEGPHQLQVFEIWVTLYVYFRRQFPQLSSTGILSLVTQKWETDKQSIIQRYLQNSEHLIQDTSSLFQIEDSSSSSSSEIK